MSIETIFGPELTFFLEAQHRSQDMLNLLFPIRQRAKLTFALTAEADIYHKLDTARGRTIVSNITMKQRCLALKLLSSLDTHLSRLDWEDRTPVSVGYSLDQALFEFSTKEALKFVRNPYTRRVFGEKSVITQGATLSQIVSTWARVYKYLN